MIKKNKDAVVVRDSAGRRTLLREGAALLLAGSALSAAGSAYGDDCDRSQQPGETKTPGNGTDSDAGDTADRQGCGRADAQISSLINKHTPAVAKIKA